MSATPTAAAERAPRHEARVDKLLIKNQSEFQLAFDAMFAADTKARQGGLISKDRDRWKQALEAVQDEGVRVNMADEMVAADGTLTEGILTQEHFDKAIIKKQKESADIAASADKTRQPETIADVGTGVFSMKLDVPRYEGSREVNRIEGNASETYRAQVLALKRTAAETAGSDQEEMQKLNGEATQALEGIRSNVVVNLEGQVAVSLPEWETKIEAEAFKQWKTLTGRVSGTEGEYLTDVTDKPLLKYALEHKAEETLSEGRELKYKLVYASEPIKSETKPNTKLEGIELEGTPEEQTKQIVDYLTRDMLVSQDDPEMAKKAAEGDPNAAALFAFTQAYDKAVEGPWRNMTAGALYSLVDNLKGSKLLSDKASENLNKFLKDDFIKGHMNGNLSAFIDRTANDLFMAAGDTREEAKIKVDQLLNDKLYGGEKIFPITLLATRLHEGQKLKGWKGLRKFITGGKLDVDKSLAEITKATDGNLKFSPVEKQLIKLIVQHDALYNVVKETIGNMGINLDEMGDMKKWAQEQAAYIARSSTVNEEERNDPELMKKRIEAVNNICGFNQISMENLDFKGRVMGPAIILALFAQQIQGLLSSAEEEAIIAQRQQ